MTEENQEQPQTPAGRRITILGMGPTAFRKADCIEQYLEGTEVWSMNNAYLTFPSLFHNKGFDRFYEIHSWSYLQQWNPGNQSGMQIDHFATLQQLGCPVFTVDRLPVIPDQRPLPYVDIVKAFGEQVEIKGTPSWMLAHALLEHAQGNKIEYIQSYGIDTEDERHKGQRPSWAQWCVTAEALGIKLGGTMTAFRNVPEDDEGLDGLLDLTKNIIKQEKDQDDELRSDSRLLRVS